MCDFTIGVPERRHDIPRMIPRLAPIAFAVATLLAPHAAAAQSAATAAGNRCGVARARAQAGAAARSAAGQSAAAAVRRQPAPGAVRARGWRLPDGRHLPARRPRRRHRRAVRRGLRQGRVAHAPRDRARGLAALRFRQRRDLGQGRRADPPGHRLDHRPRSPLQARHRDGILHLAALLRRRERLARQRGGDPLRGPRPLRSHRRALHDLRRAARGLVRPDGRARGRQGADGRHRPRRDRVFLRRAGRLFAVVRVSAVERAQVGFPDADHGTDRHSRLRVLAAVLPQSRAQLRRDDHAAPDDQARRADRRPGALPVRQRPGRGQRGIPATTTASPAPTATRCRPGTRRISISCRASSATGTSTRSPTTPTSPICRTVSASRRRRRCRAKAASLTPTGRGRFSRGRRVSRRCRIPRRRSRFPTIACRRRW